MASSYPPPIGRFNQVEGRRLWLHRSGTAGPAVVFLPGASAVGLDYLNVHDRVCAFTTSVLYDRGGTGWSDPIDLPRTAAEVATELNRLLRAEGVPAPYVLVAHSLGGAYARRYAQLFPDEVAGARTPSPRPSAICGSACAEEPAVKEVPTLTIGQLASHAGVTVRAIRYYHQRGLLPEPRRDTSGYRRYDALAVVDLIRIKTLAAGGVPLSRIAELLSASRWPSRARCWTA